MAARLVPALLLALLVIIQAQLWFGRGSVSAVAGLRANLESQKTKNVAAKQGNDRLDAEVRDLKDGLEMVEEKARMELGMIKPNEVFVQIAK
jgi:cell division protein FtsB